MLALPAEILLQVVDLHDTPLLFVLCTLRLAVVILRAIRRVLVMLVFWLRFVSLCTFHGDFLPAWRELPLLVDTPSQSAGGEGGEPFLFARGELSVGDRALSGEFAHDRLIECRPAAARHGSRGRVLQFGGQTHPEHAGGDFLRTLAHAFVQVGACHLHDLPVAYAADAEM